MFRALARLIAVPHKLAMLDLMRGMKAQMRMMTAAALVRSGLLEQLQEPRTMDELAAACDVRERDVLRHLLELAVRRRLLRRRGERYVAHGRLARCLGRSDGRPIASLLQEVMSYHSEVFARLPERLRGETPRDYLDRYGSLVAESSRLLEPWICAFTRDVVGTSAGKHILELGCGSGAYLAFYAQLHAGHHGVGVDLDASVVAAASQLLRDAGCADRFAVRQADIREASTFANEKLDIVTAHQNVYYFDAAERAVLWRRCRECLTEGGRLVIVTPTGGGPLSDYFSLILLSSAGCHRLPSIDELVAELRAAGFASIRKERLVPGDAVWGIAAG